ncbi:MAG: DNA primase, partial [Acidobacteria bacterium]
MDLQGKRIVWGSETKQGDKLNIAQIKLLTGGGEISGRRLYGDQYSFDPTHTLFLMTNNKPHADANDKAFWSRACLVEFGMRFVDDPKEKNERQKDDSLNTKLDEEASGILAWLVRGTLNYQQEGLNRPEIVKGATEAYRVSEDRIQQFITECCVCKDNVSVKAKQLYDAYVEWCRNNQIRAMDGKLFGQDISKRFIKVHMRDGWRYQKIGLLPSDNTPPDVTGGDGYP